MTSVVKKLFPLIAIATLVSSAFADEIISFDLVRTSAGTLEARMPYESSTSVRVGDRLELSSDDGYDFRLSVSKTSYSELGNRIIHASTDAGGKAVLVVSTDGTMLGSISEYGERHQISTTADGRKRIVREGYTGFEKRIDEGGLAPEQVEPVAEIQLELGEQEAFPTPYRIMKNDQSSEVIYPTYKTGTATISVLMYYDDSMSNPLSTIDFITQLAKDAFADSGARVELDIVGVKAINIDDDSSHKDLYQAMYRAEAPFEDITQDRSFYSADLIHLVRATESPEGGDPCGYGYLGVLNNRHFRASGIGLVQTKRNDGLTCSDYTFAHEVGHNLGAQHNREDLTDEGDVRIGAYNYSHGRTLDGLFRTVMGVNGDTPTNRLGLFSSPSLNCDGYACGTPASDSDSADNVSTFHSTGHLIASNEGPFAFEAVSTYATRGDEDTCTTSDETDGFFRGVFIRNQSAFSVEVLSTHFGRPDGTYRITEHDAESFTLEPGRTYGWGFCREDGEDPVMGTVYDKAFHRYLHPETGQIVETTTHEWDDSYDGEYRTVRVASGQGGSVSGNTTKSVRVGSSQTFNFTPNSGYVIDSIQSNCSGQRNGNSFTVDVGQDNCFVEAVFQEVEDQGELRLSLETPVQRQTYTGIATVRGWAIAEEGIDRVDVYIDDSFFQSAPYGGEREDVGGAFPSVDGSSYSGFALTYNYSLLSRGEHKVRAEAITNDGRTISRTKTFSVDNFHKPFIGPEDEVSLNNASCSVMDSEISIFDAYIDGRAYDLMLEWRSADQNFQIFDIR